jgi:hypothetical protein
MDKKSETEPTSKKISLEDKARRILTKLFPGRERHIDENAFKQTWDDDTRLALRTEIESRPNWIDSDKMISTAYQRLTSLLGPPDKEGVTPENIRNRIIFTDPETLAAFRYLFEQPGEDSDKYWKSPVLRVFETRGNLGGAKVLMTHAVSFGMLGIIMAPNEKEPLKDRDKPDREYIEKQGINPDDYPELVFKRFLAHELSHFLYPDGLWPHHLLSEPLVDYLAILVFPEILGIDVKLSWAKASIEDYLKRLGYKSVGELTRPISTENISNEYFSGVAKKVCQKYYPKIEYTTLSYPEEILNQLELSKYSPIPE